MSSAPTTELAYFNFALAFEAALASNDWKSTVGPYLADNVRSETGGAVRLEHAERRAGVLAAFEQSCDHFDRRFDARIPRLTAAPVYTGTSVHMHFIVTYLRAGLPPCEVRGEEWNDYEDGLIVRHVERISNQQEIFDFVMRHHVALRPVRSGAV